MQAHRLLAQALRAQTLALGFRCPEESAQRVLPLQQGFFKGMYTT